MPLLDAVVRPLPAVYREGDRAYRALLSAIDTARERIWIESYIFAADGVGSVIARALARRAACGIDVRVLADAVGSAGHATQAQAHWLVQSGVRWRWFHPWSWGAPARYNTRNHCKLWIVDNDRAWVGGLNIHRQASRQASGEKRWGDCHARACAQLVQPLADTFVARWDGYDGDYRPHKEPTHPAIVVSGPGWRCRHHLRCQTQRWMSQARQRLWLITPYFVPPRGIMRQLRRCARRGVDVRILIPHRSDVAAVDWAARHAARRLQRKRITVRYFDQRFLHSKVMIRDDHGIWLGSANLDYRSLSTNHELNLMVDDARANAIVARWFCRDFSAARPTPPPRTWLQRLLETTAWSVRRWL